MSTDSTLTRWQKANPGLAQAARRKGGRSGKGLQLGELGPLETPADAMRRCQIVQDAVAEKRLTETRGNTILRGIEVWLKAFDIGAQQTEIRQLRSLVEGRAA